MTPSTVQPRLVLVHGTRMNGAQWAPYRRRLTGVDISTPDLPGHGVRAHEDFTGEAALATIEEAVRGAAGRPVVLVGHSLGGYLCTMYAAAHPRDLAGLVLVGATADPAGPLTGLYRGFARLLPHIGAERMASTMNRVMRVLGARGEVGESLPDGAAYRALPAAWQLVIEEAGPALLEQVETPLVLVNGQFDQMRLHVRRFAAAAAGPVRTVTIPRATHLLPATHVPQLSAVLEQVVDAVAQAGPSPATYDEGRDHHDP